MVRGPATRTCCTRCSTVAVTKDDTKRDSNTSLPDEIDRVDLCDATPGIWYATASTRRNLKENITG